MTARCRFSLFCIAIFAASAAIAGADETAPAHLASGRVDEAIAALHGQINSSPNDAVAQNLLCRAYFSLGQWDRGISACEKAVALAPENGQYHLWLGRIYGEKADKASFLTAAGLAGKVRTEFETAVKLTPNNVDARSDLAEFYLEAPGIVGGGRDKAMQQISPLAQLDPARAHWVSARVAEKKKDLATAEAEYRAAIDSSSSTRRFLSFSVSRTRSGGMSTATGFPRLVMVNASPRATRSSNRDTSRLLFETAGWCVIVLRWQQSTARS